MTVQAQSEKERKYDRQLRLWASSGQALLENTHVALIGGTAVGSELLKDLILPNVGSFTVIDGEVVKEDVDLSANFFVEAENVGLPRASVVVDLLSELNEDVKGFAIEKSLRQLLAGESGNIEKQKEFWKQFSVVIVSESLPSDLLKLSDILWDLHIPLVVIDSFSFFGSIFVSVPEHTVVESHPISLVDLRLDCSWPELDKLVASYDLASLDEVDHAHVPYPVLLLKYMEAWKHDHDGASPKTSAEKRQFKAFVDSMRSGTDQENYDEAIANAWHLYQDSTVSSEIHSILDNPQAQHIIPSSTKFWVLVAALRKFVSAENSRLPLSGVLPDMKADTTGFLKLQAVYRQKAAADKTRFKELLYELLDAAGRPRDAITDDEIDTFCKNSAHIKVIAGTSLRELFVDVIHSTKRIDEDEQDELYLNDSTDQFHIYIAILAIKGYVEQYGAQAGRKAMDALEQERLNTIALDYIKAFGGSTVYPQTSKILREM
jgi:amyloid beta precursor protein binding protein 1